MLSKIRSIFLISKNTRRLLNYLDNELKSDKIAFKEIKSDRSKYVLKIDDIIDKMPLNHKDIKRFIINIKSYEHAYENLKKIKKAENLKLEAYFDFKKITNLLIKGVDVEFYFTLAKYFKNFNLEENGQGDFNKITKYIDIPDAHLEHIVNAMVFTKNAGCPLSQKDIVKYYDSNRPLSEDVNDLKDAWIFAYEHKIKINITDLIRAIKYGRKPHKYIVNYNRILVNDLPIGYEKFKIFDISQEKITELLDLLIKSKHAEIYLDFDIIYDDIKLKRDVWSVIRYLIRFENSEFKTVNYDKLRNFLAYGGDLDKLHEAFLYNRERTIIDEKILYERVLEIILVKNANLKFDALLCVKAIELAYIHIEEEYKKSGGSGFKKTEVANKVFNDYLAGVDVYEIMNYLKYAKEHDVYVSYNNARILNKMENVSFKDIIYKSLNPILLKNTKTITDQDGNETKTPNTFNVTTKDNIEIIIDMEIQAVLNPNNYIKGSDEKILFERSRAIMIDEIQKKYKHDEIIQNVEKICNNVLFRLNEEIREVDLKYIPVSKMNKPKTEDSHHKTEQKNISEENEIHISEDEQHKITLHKDNDETYPKATNNKVKFLTASKYKPLKILLPRIEYEKRTFKDLEKEIEEFEHHKLTMHEEIEKLKAEVEIKKSWAKDQNVRYKFLEDEQKDTTNKHH